MYSVLSVVVYVVQQLSVQGGIQRAGEVDHLAGEEHGHYSGDHPAPPQH